MDAMTNADENLGVLQGKRLAFVGKLASMSRRDAGQLVRRHGATVLDRPDASVHLVVVGEEELPLAEGEGPEQWFDESARLAAEKGDLEIITETQLWHRLGLVEHEQDIHRLYTPAMLAELLGVPVAIIRRWHRRLSVIVQGKQILLRQGDGLIEPGGQMRFDFDAWDVAEPPERAIPSTADQMCNLAAELEEDGQLSAAAEMYRAAMAAGGPKPEICFMVAELLYRQGDLCGARERYYMAIELDEDYVEARANLGCVLAETGQRDLAVAAFEGALRFHGDYADVHYHLARTLDEIGQGVRAVGHWERFLALAPDSPWADEAAVRLG
ncbi:MAG: BRCT domain-containing protein [Thermoguttaceae bacterium]